MYSAQTEHMAEVPFKRYTTALPVSEQVSTASSDLFVGLRKRSRSTAHPRVHLGQS